MYRNLPTVSHADEGFDSSPATRILGARRRSSGQALVEFALILPLLIGILAVTADFGRAFTAYIQVSSAAREGAIYGAGSLAASADTVGMQAAGRNAVGDGGTIWGDPVTVTPGTCADPVDSVRFRCVQVTASYTFEPLLGIWPLDGSYQMSRTIQMRVIS